MPQYLIYPLYTGTIALIMYLLVPRKIIKQLFFNGVIFGGVIDFIILYLLYFFGLGGYINYGPLGFAGIPLFPLIAWTSYFIMYLYLLPEKSYIFAILAAVYSTLFSNVLQNLGIFKWTTSRVILPFIVYALWHLLVTWLYKHKIIES